MFTRVYSGLTVASFTAFSGMLMRGKEYMAPCTGLQLMPGTVLRTCSVSLAFSAKALSVAVRSWKTERGEKIHDGRDREKGKETEESRDDENNKNTRKCIGSGTMTHCVSGQISNVAPAAKKNSSFV